jgi:hypothetical protein
MAGHPSRDYAPVDAPQAYANLVTLHSQTSPTRAGDGISLGDVFFLYSSVSVQRSCGHSCHLGKRTKLCCEPFILARWKRLEVSCGSERATQLTVSRPFLSDHDFCKRGPVAAKATTPSTEELDRFTQQITGQRYPAKLYSLRGTQPCMFLGV